MGLQVPDVFPYLRSAALTVTKKNTTTTTPAERIDIELTPRSRCNPVSCAGVGGFRWSFPMTRRRSERPISTTCSNFSSARNDDDDVK